MGKKLRECQFCKREFTPDYPNRRYCTNKKCVTAHRQYKLAKQRQYQLKYHKKYKKKNSIVENKCLKCQEMFFAENKFIRRCPYCKLKERFLYSEAEIGGNF